MPLNGHRQRLQRNGSGSKEGDDPAHRHRGDRLHDAVLPTGRRDVPDLDEVMHSGAAEAILFARSAPNAVTGGHATRSEVALPVAGLFTWAVGRSHAIIDANTALFISAHQDFSETHPVAGLGHACVIVVPGAALLDEMRFADPSRPADLFAAVTRPATARAQLLARRILELRGRRAALEGDELCIAFLLETALDAPLRQRRAPATIAKAKEILHSLDGALSLETVAKEVGVTPIYLTKAFKASEGTPLYRYHLNLRLSRALGELPHCQSLTELAFELGFSSHSHFSACFAARYGVSPSKFRTLSTIRAATFNAGSKASAQLGGAASHRQNGSILTAPSVGEE